MIRIPFDAFGRLAAGGLVLAAIAAWAPPAAADTLPLCDQSSSLITCAAADVGKPCQGGGMCYAMPCANIGGMNGMVYKCDACPTVLAQPDGGCSQSNLGTPCSDGGTCSGINGYCGAATKFVCSSPASSKPTGPPAGETDGGAGGGAGSGTGGSAGSSAGGGPGGGAGSGTSGGAGSSGGGCDVNYGAPTAGVIAIALVAVGMVFLVIGRRRRSR
jgi:hypothetical protein